MIKRQRRLLHIGILGAANRATDVDDQSDSDETTPISSVSSGSPEDLGRLPRETLLYIHSLADARTKLQSSLASKGIQSEVAWPEQPDQICLLVFKLLSRRSPTTGEWEGSANRAAYWWVGQRGVMRGPSHKPPAEVSKRLLILQEWRERQPCAGWRKNVFPDPL